ncbi:MAG: hypothetical protein ACKO6N_02690 [Myxococcota bacterium]
MLRSCCSRLFVWPASLTPALRRSASDWHFTRLWCMGRLLMGVLLMGLLLIGLWWPSTGRAADPDPLGEAWSRTAPPLPPAKAPFMEVSEVRPGMQVVAYTVFEGSTVEPFRGVVKGIARGMLGPQRDVVIVLFEEPRMKHVGIVHGMSGSPVYIGGKLLGALSLALSPLPKDALGGVTPISYMLDEAKLQGPGPGSPRSHLTWPERSDVTPTLPLPLSQPSRASGAMHGGTVAPQAPFGAGLWLWRGLDPEVFAHYQTRWAAQPMLLQTQPDFSPLPERVASASTRPQPSPGAAPLGSASLGAAPLGAGIVPGGSVAVVLAEGDINLMATGTVTWRDDKTVLGFGHPFLQQGLTRLPMAEADVVATVADQTYPYKLSNLGKLVGTITADRVTAIVGTIGAPPPMIPVEVEIKQHGEVSTRLRVRLVDDREVGPLLYQVVLSSALRRPWRFLQEGTFNVKSTLTLKGGASLTTQGTYTLSQTPDANGMFDIIDALARPYTLILQNPFERAEIERVQVHIDATPEEKLYRIQRMQVDSLQVRAGEKVQVRVQLSKHLGSSQELRFQVPIPQNAAGPYTLSVADLETVEARGHIGGRPDPTRAEDLPQLLTLLQRQRVGDGVYVQLLRKTQGVKVRQQELPALPASARQLLELKASSEVAPYLEQQLVFETQQHLDGAVVGNEELELEILPPR